MSDSFGSFQPKTHEVEDRSLDCVVFGKAVPTRSDTWTLQGQVAQSAARRANTSPSGWMQVGSTTQVPASELDSETSQAVDGQILTSLGLPVNTLRLVSTGGLRALVNGWTLDVSGANSTEAYNDIALPSMDLVSSGRMDFVLLEAWRELVPVDSSLYTRGNTQSTSSPMTTVVTPLVQIRYRIRSVPGPIQVSGGAEGFGPRVLSRGGATTESSYLFSNMASAGDPGLWRAGDGTEASKIALNSVDGYSYAIPLLGVYRRGHLPSGYSISSPSSTASSKVGGRTSDRPDGLFYDSVHASDIVDLRHRVSFGTDLKMLADKTFAQLVAGTLSSTVGEAHLTPSVAVEVPGGSLLSKCDVIGKSIGGAPHVGTMRVGQGLHKPRTACCASVTHKSNLVGYYPGTAWKANTTYVVQLSGPTEYGHYQVGTPTGAYTSDGAIVLSLSTDVVCTLSSYRNSWEVTIPANSKLAGTSYHVTFQYPAEYQRGHYGLLDVPSKVLEVRNSATGAQIPVEGQNITPAKALSSSRDYLSNFGADSGSTWNSGVTISYHVVAAPGSDSVAIQLTNGVLYGHSVAGVQGVRRVTANGSYSGWKNHSVSREVSGNTIVYTVADVDSNPEDTDTLQVVFQASTKFFELSRNARGVTNVLRTYEAPVVYNGGSYYVCTDGYPIVGISHYIQANGVDTPCAYVSGMRVPLKVKSRFTPVGSSTATSLSSLLPIESPSSYLAGSYLPDRVLVEFDGTTTVRPTMEITVPVTVLSSMDAGESYEVHYLTRGYQGLLRSVPVRGSVLGHSGYLLSSSGSGSVHNKTVHVSALLGSTSDKRVVVNAGPSWEGRAQPGDYLAKASDPETLYRIASVQSGSLLTLESAYDLKGDSDVTECLVIRKDCPESGHPCLADRMPSVRDDSFLYHSQGISSAGSDLSDCHRCIRKDPLSSERNDVLVGSGSKVFRGRSGMLLSRNSNEGYPEVSYGPMQSFGSDVRVKAYQGWTFLNDATGRVYLAVSSGEYDGNNEFVSLLGGIGTDATDLFEIVGRPLIARG